MVAALTDIASLAPPTGKSGGGGARPPASCLTVPKPKRPLTAYNLFFQYERERILRDDSASPLDRVDADESAGELMLKLLPTRNAVAADGSCGGDSGGGCGGGGSGAAGPRRRRHGQQQQQPNRKKVGFTQLARTVSHKWKELDPKRKAVFEALAKVDRRRYDAEMADFKKAQAEEVRRNMRKIGFSAAAAERVVRPVHHLGRATEAGGHPPSSSSPYRDPPSVTGRRAISPVPSSAAPAASVTPSSTDASMAGGAAGDSPSPPAILPRRSAEIPPEVSCEQMSHLDVEPTALSDIAPTPDDPKVFLTWAFQEDTLHPAVPRVTLQEMCEEMRSMSLTEREEANAKLHGMQIGGGLGFAAGGHLEGLVRQLIESMRAEIVAVPIEEKRGLLLCRDKCDREKEFSDERLGLFLQRDGMDIKKAARRFINYWNRRLELFGPDKFHLPMTLTGALRDDMAAAETGMLQIMPRPDASGRVMLLYDKSRNTLEGYTRENLSRYLWYILETLLEHPSARNGVPILIWDENTSLWNFDRKVNAFVAELEREVFPVEFVAFHECCPSFVMRHLLLPIAFAIIDKKQRTRVRTHPKDEGGDLYRSLGQYGITKDVIPKKYGGDLEFDYLRWLRARRDSGR